MERSPGALACCAALTGLVHRNITKCGLQFVQETKYTKEGPGTPGGSSWTPEWLHFDNSYFTEVKQARGAQQRTPLRLALAVLTRL